MSSALVETTADDRTAGTRALPPAAVHELHLARWRHRRRRRCHVAGRGINNGYGIAGALSYRLEDLRRLRSCRGRLLKSLRSEAASRRREEELRGRLQLLLEWRLLWRTAGKRRAVRARGVDGMKLPTNVSITDNEIRKRNIHI